MSGGFRGHHPQVSVLMPLRNERAYVRRSLGSVLDQDYPSDRLEVLIVDGMSTDGTRDLVQQMIEALPSHSPAVRLLDNPEHIVAPGLNRATGKARGEVLIRVDGHCEVPSSYVSRCVAHLISSGADGVGGRVVTVGETATARAIALAMSSRFGVGGSAFRTSALQRADRWVDSVPFPAYTREIVERAGFYDEELVRDQDDEYNYRIRKLGGKLLLAGNIESRYYSRGSLGSLFRQYRGYGYWKVRVLQKHPRQMNPRQFVPPLFVLGLVASLPAFLSRRLRSYAGVFVAAYLLANLTTSLALAWRNGLQHMLRLPLAFALLHLGYGIGFLTGLVRFRGRWKERAGGE